MSFRVVSWIVFFEPKELIHEIIRKDAEEMECTTANEPARIEGVTRVPLAALCDKLNPSMLNHSRR